MKKRWLNRRAARGVAMVEAGILAPIFAMMMMMTVYLGGVYNAKYKSFVQERYYTWYYGASGCQASIANSSNDGQATQDQSTPGDPCNQVQGGAQASAGMFVAHAYDEEVWAYQPTLKFNNGQPKKIQTDGYMICNEKKVKSGVGGIFSQLAGEVSSLVGSVSSGNHPCGS